MTNPQIGNIPPPPPGFVIDHPPENVPAWAQTQAQAVPQWARAEPSPDDAVMAHAANAGDVDRVSQLYHQAKAAGNDAVVEWAQNWLSAHGAPPVPANAQTQAKNADIAATLAGAHPQASNQLESGALALVHHLTNPIYGVGQDLVHGAAYVGDKLAPAPVANALDAARGATDNYINNREANYQAFVPNGVGTAVGAGVGEIAPWLLGAGELRAAGAIPEATSALGKLAQLTAGGAAMAGTQPVIDGDFARTKALQTGVGAGMGAAGGVLSPVARWLGMKAAPNISDAKKAGIALAEKYGIPLHLGQVADSRFLQSIGAAAKYLPFSGTAAADRAQQQAFNRALSNQIGENSPTLSDDVLGNAAAKIGQGYNDLFARNRVRITPDVARKLTDVINNAQKFGGTDAGRIVGNHVDNIVNQLDQNGEMPGRLYQNIRNDQLLPAEARAQPGVAHYVKQVRKVLQDAARDSMGQSDAGALRDLNNKYGSLKILQKAGKRAAGADESVSPPTLWNLVNSKYGSTPEMRDLARMGQTVLKEPIANSGTAQRMLAYRMLGAGGLAGAGYFDPDHRGYWLGTAGLLAGGPTIGRFMNSPFVARTLPYAGMNALGKIGAGAEYLPYLAPGAADRVH